MFSFAKYTENNVINFQVRCVKIFLTMTRSNLALHKICKIHHYYFGEYMNESLELNFGPSCVTVSSC